MENLTSSTDRLAWQPTREQGMGSGLTIHNDKQPNLLPLGEYPIHCIGTCFFDIIFLSVK